ncbi:MurR/RpiR family transcriptional regulator [Pelistega europaea]|uniref:MurR/RpiR family transcriptional regulator n=1 Tax=Pelistega europaea TaxID=106147 RepID=A0A7Y4L8L2_9BURK|nr:MurR/RpiR family transcriptional regulator [Pelistega europaea]NOL48995.1 MurR/RpiR family transcriptional regulator [Pelistega europaea]
MNSKNLAVLIREQFQYFAPNEKKVARVLLNQYPVAGLETIAQLAKKASVSGPTVLRLITKLGFDGYGQFQEALRRELEAHLQTPISRRDPNQDIEKHEVLSSFCKDITLKLNETAKNILPEDFEAAVDILANKNAKIWLIGGYLTGPLSEYFYRHLQSIRSDVSLLHPVPVTWINTLADIKKNDVLVVFDIRRYWNELQPFMQIATEKKCKSILITDQWISPLSGIANITLPAYTEGKSGWDTNVCVMFIIDALISALNNKDWEKTKERLEKIESLRSRCGF